MTVKTYEAHTKAELTAVTAAPEPENGPATGITGALTEAELTSVMKETMAK